MSTENKQLTLDSLHYEKNLAMSPSVAVKVFIEIYNVSLQMIEEKVKLLRLMLILSTLRRDILFSEV